MKRNDLHIIITLLITLIMQSGYTQVGIGTTEPATTLDVVGAMSLRDGNALVLSNGITNNLALGVTPHSSYKITGPTSSFSISGIVPVPGSDGQIITLENNAPNTNMTIIHDSSSTAVNRIVCPGERDLTLSGRYSAVTLQYIKSQARWIILNFSDNSYGGNIKTVKGTTDLDTSSTSFSDMAGMSITFTPNHSAVYLNYSASGAAIETLLTAGNTYVLFRVVQDATTVVAGTASLVTDKVIETSGVVRYAFAWNAQLSMHPIQVTPGVSTTFKIQWRMGGSPTTSATIVKNHIVTQQDFSHRNLTIFD